jgi:hypothetical protein
MTPSQLLLAAMEHVYRDDLFQGICFGIECVLESERWDKNAAHALTQLFEPEKIHSSYWGLQWSDRLAELSKTLPTTCIQQVATPEELDEVYNCRLTALCLAAAMAEGDESES